MKVGDLVKPVANQSGIPNDPRGIGIITGKHMFWADAWTIRWSYCYPDQSRGEGFGSAYEESLEVINESR